MSSGIPRKYPSGAQKKKLKRKREAAIKKLTSVSEYFTPSSTVKVDVKENQAGKYLIIMINTSYFKFNNSKHIHSQCALWLLK